jgi:hypothetical protein
VAVSGSHPQHAQAPQPLDRQHRLRTNRPTQCGSAEPSASPESRSFRIFRQPRDIGGVRIRLCEAGAGRVQPPKRARPGREADRERLDLHPHETTGRVEPCGAGDNGFRFRPADSESGSAATRCVSATEKPELRQPCGGLVSDLRSIPFAARRPGQEMSYLGSGVGMNVISTAAVISCYPGSIGIPPAEAEGAWILPLRRESTLDSGSASLTSAPRRAPTPSA